MRRGVAGGTAWTLVHEVGGCVESLCLERRWRRCVKEHGADAVVQSSQRPFSLAILCRCVGAGEAEGNALSLKILSQSIGVEFAPIVSLEGMDRQAKLRLNIRAKRQYWDRTSDFCSKGKDHT